MRLLAVFVAATLAATPVRADDKCAIEPAPVPPTAPIAKAKCHRAPAKIEKAIRAAIVKDFEPEHTGGKASVKFDCDGLAPKIAEIVIETGGGHGGSLDLWRARRRVDGEYDVRGIVYRGSSMMHKAASTPFELATGAVALGDLDEVRAALSATITEVVPPAKPGTFGGLSGSSSSHDFHLVIRLVDDDGRVLERRFTGYAGSSHQDRYLGLEIAAQALAPITSVAAVARTADADDQALFAERFTTATPHFDDDFYWWVMERYVDLARFLGTPATIAGLLTRLTVTKPDRSKVDARADAVEALARITGWDARKTTKSIEQAAARYLAECKPRH